MMVTVSKGGVRAMGTREILMVPLMMIVRTLKRFSRYSEKLL